MQPAAHPRPPPPTCPGPRPPLRLQHPNGQTAEVSLYGACVTQWTKPSGVPALYYAPGGHQFEMGSPLGWVGLGPGQCVCVCVVCVCCVCVCVWGGGDPGQTRQTDRPWRATAGRAVG
jgi:hypothetical protein